MKESPEKLSMLTPGKEEEGDANKGDANIETEIREGLRSLEKEFSDDALKKEAEVNLFGIFMDTAGMALKGAVVEKIKMVSDEQAGFVLDDMVKFELLADRAYVEGDKKLARDLGLILEKYDCLQDLAVSFEEFIQTFSEFVDNRDADGAIEKTEKQLEFYRNKLHILNSKDDWGTDEQRRYEKYVKRSVQAEHILKNLQSE